MRTIPLKTGELLQVDDADYEKCSRFKWYRKVSSSGNIYAVANIARVNGIGGRIYAHQLVLTPPKGVDIDHRDNIGLNCCRSNLRYSCDSNNRRSKLRKALGTSSRYRGVSWCKNRCMWRARIEVLVGGKRRSKCGGYYDDEGDAALAYNDLAAEHGFFTEALNQVPARQDSIVA